MWSAMNVAKKMRAKKNRVHVQADNVNPEDIDLLHLSSEESCEEDDVTIAQSALQRVAIIDTANVMHQCAQSTPSPFAAHDEAKCDAIGILWLTRELIRQGYDVKLFIPNSYMAGNFSNEQLGKIGLLTTIKDHCHDDLLMLEYAKMTGGFVISNDKYRDHEKLYETRDLQSVKIIRERVVRFNFYRLGFNDKSVRKLFGRSQDEKVFATAKANGFLQIECTLRPPSMKAMFSWDRKKDETHAIVFDMRKNRDQKIASRNLERIEVMCEFIRLRFCEIYNVAPERLPYFEPGRHQLDNFFPFWKRQQIWHEEMLAQQRRAQEEAKKARQFGGRMATAMLQQTVAQQQKPKKIADWDGHGFWDSDESMGKQQSSRMATAVVQQTVAQQQKPKKIADWDGHGFWDSDESMGKQQSSRMATAVVQQTVAQQQKPKKKEVEKKTADWDGHGWDSDSDESMGKQQSSSTATTSTAAATNLKLLW